MRIGFRCVHPGAPPGQIDGEHLEGGLDSLEQYGRAAPPLSFGNEWREVVVAVGKMCGEVSNAAQVGKRCVDDGVVGRVQRSVMTGQGAKRRSCEREGLGAVKQPVWGYTGSKASRCQSAVDVDLDLVG